MIRRQMRRRQMRIASLAQRGRESIVLRSEPIVGSNDECAAVVQGVDLGVERPVINVVPQFAREAIGGATAQRAHAFVGEAGAHLLRAWIITVLFAQLRHGAGHVGGGDHGEGLDGGVRSRTLHGHEAAHAVADQHEARGVESQCLGVFGLAKIGQRGGDIFDAVGEGEIAGCAHDPR
jgi:hypothetical protein